MASLNPEWGVFSLEKASGDLITASQYLKGIYRKDGTRLFTSACCHRTRENGLNQILGKKNLY